VLPSPLRLLGKFPFPSSFFWCFCHTNWWPGGHPWLFSGEPRRRHSRAPPRTARLPPAAPLKPRQLPDLVWTVQIKRAS
jgi:hypothetical protein